MRQQGGLIFEESPDGGVTIRVGHNATENAEIIRVVMFTPEEWREVLKSCMPTLVVNTTEADADEEDDEDDEDEDDDAAAGTGHTGLSGDAPPAGGGGSNVIGEVGAGGLDKTPGTIATVVSDLAIDLIEKATTGEELDACQKDEEASQKHPGGRKGVLEAIEKRRKELAQ